MSFTLYECRYIKNKYLFIFNVSKQPFSYISHKRKVPFTYFQQSKQYDLFIDTTQVDTYPYLLRMMSRGRGIQGVSFFVWVLILCTPWGVSAQFCPYANMCIVRYGYSYYCVCCANFYGSYCQIRIPTSPLPLSRPNSFPFPPSSWCSEHTKKNIILFHPYHLLLSIYLVMLIEAAHASLFFSSFYFSSPLFSFSSSPPFPFSLLLFVILTTYPLFSMIPSKKLATSYGRGI